MALIDVRIAEARNALAFRFDPECDTIEIILRGELHVVELAAYRTPFDGRLTEANECATLDDVNIGGANRPMASSGERITG